MSKIPNSSKVGLQMSPVQPVVRFVLPQTSAWLVGLVVTASAVRCNFKPCYRCTTVWHEFDVLHLTSISATHCICGLIALIGLGEVPELVLHLTQ